MFAIVASFGFLFRTVISIASIIATVPKPVLSHLIFISRNLGIAILYARGLRLWATIWVLV